MKIDRRSAREQCCIKVFILAISFDSFSVIVNGIGIFPFSVFIITFTVVYLCNS